MNPTSQSPFHALKLKFDQLLAWTQEHNTLLNAVLVGVIIIAGGWYGYRYWSISKEEAAHTILTDCLSEFDRAAQGKGQWADVAMMCHAGYEKFSGTAVAPYILAVETDALLAQEKNDQALDTLDRLLARISTSSPLYNLYALKRALLQIDMSDVAIQEKGFHALEQLAADTNNIYNDAAQFYLGYYYRAHDDEAHAKQIWQPLIAMNDALTDQQAKSPWATLAQEKLGGLH